MNLHSRVAALASQKPRMAQHLLPLLRNATGGSFVAVGGSARIPYLESVWSMYTATYRVLGLIVQSPGELLHEFPVWDLFVDGKGQARAFNLSKSTPFGQKSGLSGQDGTPEGKSALLSSLRAKFHQPGFYGEVSHKVLDIAIAAGAPVVCGVYVEKILGKKVEVLEDGIHYKRSLAGVGPVTKVLIGHPKGIPTTSLHNPVCPTGMPIYASQEAVLLDDVGDLAQHFSCLLVP